MPDVPFTSVVLVVVASLLGATGQHLIHTGSRAASSGWLSFLLNPWVLAGMACYLSVMGFFHQAFRAGGSVRVLYPIYASTFIWAAVLARWLHDDPVRPVHVAGMALLVSGIALMTR